MAGRNDRMVVWPVNIDSSKSRREGRKISRRYAVPSPTLKDISSAAKRLNLNPIIEKDKAYPREWWEVSGRVLVERTKPRSILLKEIAGEIGRVKE